MALTDGDNGNGFYMPVAPAYGGGYGNGGFGFGGDLSWIILLLLCGWGGGFGGFGGGMGGFAADGAALYPWMNQAEITQGGFRDQMINNNITSIRDGISDISTQLCSGFAGVNSSIANGFAQSEISANARQMADMNRSFALQSQFADCCCENRLGIANLGSDIAREACATRTSDTQNTQAVLNAINGGIQSIKDQIFADRLDDERRENANLRQELLFARGQASQVTQNADIINGVYNRLNECPVGTVPVYGEQPIFTCGGNSGCGCGCGGSF